MAFDFFGDQASSDIRHAKKKADAALDAGHVAQDTAYDTATQGFDPYVSSGQKSQGMYDDLLGLNGNDARSTAEGVITSDPLWSGHFADESNQIARNFNARGLGGSGAALAAGQQSLFRNYGTAFDRYKDNAAMGLQATGAQSNVITGKGDADWGYGTTKAGNDINYGNALAEHENDGLNNLLKVGGTLINGYQAAMGKPTLNAALKV